jgi:hypothetical protein
MRCALVFGLALLIAVNSSGQELGTAVATVDSDRDGLSDSVEDSLLLQFEPRFMISRKDCSVKPAEFKTLQRVPTAVADDGTIYGQATPHKGYADEIELHYYHLWRKDCGERGHRLDAEHVAVLLRWTTTSSTNTWKAINWYAAAHEDTVCDASQITRAKTLGAEDHGAQVWISEGKHASFLNEELCTHGCGGDRCGAMEALQTARLVNIGELNAPMNGAVWMDSPEWPLAEKMRRSDFTEARTSRLQRLPATDIAWANPDKRPVQAAILGANVTLGGTATGARQTNTALVLANDNTSAALDEASRNTGNALTKSYHNVMKSLQKAAQKTGDALDVKPKQR